MKLTVLNYLDTKTFESRKNIWQKIYEDNGRLHPFVGEADTRLLNRMRSSAVSAVYGAGMHPDRKLWVPNQREVELSGFIPKNIYKN